VIKLERRLLKELGFCVHVKHPHKVVQCVCNYVLVFLITKVCLNTLASAKIRGFSKQNT